MSVPFADAAYLVKVTACNQAEIDLMQLPLAGGEIDDTPFVFGFPGNPSVFYPAATIARSTVSTDVPPNAYVPAAFSGSFNFGISLFGGLDPSQAAQSSLGVLDLIDPAGTLDALTRKVWDGATIELLRGDRWAAFSTYETVATLSAAGLKWDARKKQVQLRDASYFLSGQLHDIRYAGTGGWQGDSTMAGNVRPIVYGEKHNIAPVQINAALLIYEVSCTSVQAILAVRGAGAPITFDGNDYADYDALAAATVAPGYYATCLAQGLFRLGSSPAQARITADVQGDADTIEGAGYTATRAGTARRIALGRGGLKLTPEQIDDDTFAAMDIAQPGTCGFFFDREITKADALTAVMAGCLGYWWFTVMGLLSVDYLTEVDATADFTLTVVTPGQPTGTGDVIGEPAMLVYAAPRQATYLGWASNPTVQQPNEIAGDVSEEDKAIYGLDMRKASATSTALARIWPTSQIITLDSGLLEQAAAQSEADRQQALLGVPRARWSLKARLDPFGAWLGKTFAVLGWNRYGMAAAKNYLCVAISVHGRNEVVLDLWGAL